MLYILVLGRDHELSRVEVDTLLESKNIDFKVVESMKNILVINTKDLDPKIIDEFGGVVKIAQVISNTDRTDLVEENLEKANLYNGTKNKIEYYIDAYNTDLTSFVEDYLKDYFRSIKLKALYKREAEPSKLINKNILENGVEIVIFKNLIGKTIAVSNVLEFKKRDLARPEVDYMKVISIRLAKILVNISNVKKDGLLLDSFCGSATVLQEALLKGINVIGIDSDPGSMAQAKNNLEWLAKEYKIKNSFKLINLDCRKLATVIKEKSIDGVVTEPYMGPFIRKLPTTEEAKNLVLELTSLYDSLLANLKKVIKNGGRVVIIVPKLRTRENKTVFIDFKSIIEKNGFNLALKPINYGYKENKLLRDIYVLENN